MIKTAVSIEPYFDPEVPNMGFEKYGLSTAPGSELTEFISKDKHGRYITGLDTKSPALSFIEDEEERTLKIAEIEETFKRLSDVYGEHRLDPTNDEFWGNFSLKLTHTGKSLDVRDPMDQIYYSAILAGGFDSVAPSLEEARRGDYKFYMRHVEKDADLKIEHSKMINKAKAGLTDLDETDSHKLLLVAKSVLAANNEFHSKTPKSILYDKLDQFIDGKIVKDNKKQTVKQFLEAYKKDVETLYFETLVKDALYFSFITREGDGYFYNKQTEVRLGKTEKEVVKYIKNPINQIEFENLKDRVEAKFNK